MLTRSLIAFLWIFVVGPKELAAEEVVEKRPTVDQFFNQANFENMETVCREVYHADVIFQDPVHRVEGREAIIAYYKNMYKNVKSISFDVHQEFNSGPDEVMVRWTMHLSHARLNGGEGFSMDGVSHIIYKDAKIIFHRDYFDLGEMLYEKIPIVGAVIRGIKSRAANP